MRKDRIVPLLLFSLLLFAPNASLERGKEVAQELNKIKKASRRKIKLFLKKKIFSEKDINSYLLYIIKTRKKGNEPVLAEKAQLKIYDRYFNLKLLLRLKRPLPNLQLDAQQRGLLFVELDFKLLQNENFYRILPMKLKVGNFIVPQESVETLLNFLASQDLPVREWKKFPYGIQKIRQEKGKLILYY